MARVTMAAVGRGIGGAWPARAQPSATAPGGSRLARALALSLVVVLVVALSACAPRGTRPAGPATGPDVTSVPSPAPTPLPSGRATDGVVKVGLLLPLTGGPPGGIIQQMSQAAELAAVDFGTPDFELLPRDTGGSPDGARAAAQAVLDEGADLILGPFFGRNVASVAEAARAEGVNVIAFTTDATVAGGNVMVMGFLPGNEVERVMQYALGQGISAFSVMAPDGAYGRTVGDAAREVAAARGAQLVSVDYYASEVGDYGDFVAGALAGTQPGAILLPDAGLRLRAVASLLPTATAGAPQLLGTGIWAGQPIGGEPALVGAWYAAPDPQTRGRFAQDYASFYGGQPSVIAGLAYDAVSLAATLARQPGFSSYDRSTLTDPGGFSGVGGIFRFDRQTGLVERGLAIMEVTADGAVIRQSAPDNFVGAGL